MKPFLAGIVLTLGLVPAAFAAQTGSIGIDEFMGTGDWAASRSEACAVATDHAKRRMGSDYEMVSSECTCDKDGSRFNCLAVVKARPRAPELVPATSSSVLPSTPAVVSASPR